ncbi:MAG TPA: histidine phosphatase family protein, partial [Pseudonocardiaceae bacterium]
MATHLTLVSHAPTVATRAARFPDDEPPDEHGTAQAGATSGALRRVDEARCGPELRCRVTAAALGVTPVLDPALADLDVGAWRGQRLAELADAESAGLHAWLSDPAAAPHGGESLHDLLNRAAGWLDGLG